MARVPRSPLGSLRDVFADRATFDKKLAVLDSTRFERGEYDTRLIPGRKPKLATARS